MLIDTHCHLDASEFDSDRSAVISRCAAAGVKAIVIPAVARANFNSVRELAHSFDGGTYALGIHPIYAPQAHADDLVELESHIRGALDDPRFVAVGEIGLDFFIPGLTEPWARARQEHFYVAQLELAQRYALPVLLHVRRSQDALLKQLRRHSGVGGIAHAFNGSFQQAEQFIAQGFALGFGGAMTFERALQIRRLAARLPAESLVLETDAPDLAPAWRAAPGTVARNEPAEVAGIAKELASLRDCSVGRIITDTSLNARRVLPRLAAVLA